MTIACENGQICISVDIDWAPEAVIADTFELLESAGIKATIFATHRSSVTSEMERHGHEIGLHPNFTGQSPLKVLGELKDAFPDAIGVRSHRLVQDSAILDAFQDVGMVYDSNILAFLNNDVRAYRYYNGLWRFPIYWGDLTAARLYGPWQAQDMNFKAGVTHTFIFHAIHLFINTRKPADYDCIRPHYHDPDALQPFRRPLQRHAPDAAPGSRDALISLMECNLPKVRLKDCCPSGMP